MTKKGPKSAISGRESRSQPDAAAVRRFRAANAELRAGRPEAAIKAYRRLIRHHPRQPEAHNNLGIALKATGKLQDAAHSFRRALNIAPDYASAQANLAGLLASQGQVEDSLPHFVAAMRLEPNKPAHRQGFAMALRPIRFRAASSELIAATTACLADPGIEHQPLAPALLSLVRLDPGVSEAFSAHANLEDQAFATWLSGPDAQAFRNQPILRSLLSRVVLPDLDIEALLTRIRRLCATREVPAEAVTREPAFFAALACQCLLNDFAYDQNEVETAAVEQLGQASNPAPSDLLITAMYRPLAEQPPTRIQSLEGTDFAELIRLQMTAPHAEREIEASLPSLTPIEDSTSQAVRRQYEDNPYPRWLSARAATARPLPDVLRLLFPHLPADELPAARASLPVLVAGCGTGKHALDVARRYDKAEVLAVDLSRRSLAYAARQARDLGQFNIRFAQADLLVLEPGEERYALIEAMGVLHHLEKPLVGWRKLVALLEDRGLMRIGLYSRTARRHLEAARDFIEERGLAANPDGLRAARQALTSLPDDHPARGAIGELDFYSLSGCRDLLFHVREVGFSIPEIADALDALGLEFLGFEFADAALPRAYRERFPKDNALTDLASWAAFEAENPQTFRTMYQFWCRRRD